MPIKDLRNTTDISNIAHNGQEPIFITKNGDGDLVVMGNGSINIGIFQTRTKAEVDKMLYTFQSVKDTEKLTDSSKLYNFIDGFADYEDQFSLICGKIKALFGQPIYKTENLENLFLYCILTASEEGEEVYLHIYCAGSGPAVGGMQDEKSRRAAKALVDHVRQAAPVDYTQKAYYLDGPTALEFGIKDGVPYYNETELKLSEKEFRELYTRLC